MSHRAIAVALSAALVLPAFPASAQQQTRFDPQQRAMAYEQRSRDRVPLIAEAMRIVHAAFPNDPEQWRAAFATIGNADDPVRAARSFVAARSGPNQQPGLVQNPDDPLYQRMLAHEQREKERQAKLRQAFGIIQAAHLADDKLVRMGGMLIQQAPDPVAAAEAFVAQHRPPEPAQTVQPPVPDPAPSAAAPASAANKPEPPVAKPATTVTAPQEASQSDKQQVVDVAKLKSHYLAYRSTATPYSVPYPERCLRSMLVRDQPNYKFSNDYRFYFAGMSDVGINAETLVGLSVCPKDADQLAKIATLVSELAAENGAEWSAAATKQAMRDAEAERAAQAKKDKFLATMASRYPVTDETEAGAKPLECHEAAKPAPVFSIGDMPTVPSGTALAASTASSYTIDQSDDSTLERLLKRAQDVVSSKAEFNVLIGQARSAFFNSGPGSDQQTEAGKRFGDLLFAKDVYFITFNLLEGTSMQANERMHAIDMFSGGALDGGIWPEASSAYRTWIDALRVGMHAPPPGQLWVPTPDLYVEGLRHAMHAYAAYKRRRDAAELAHWQDEHGGGPAPLTSTTGIINAYFDLAYDYRINEKFCAADQALREQMIQNRKLLRAALFAAENVEISPETVPAIYDMKEDDPRKDPGAKDHDKYVDEQNRSEQSRLAFNQEVARRRGLGETDQRQIALEAAAVSFEPDPVVRQRYWDTHTVERHLRFRVDQKLTDYVQDLTYKYNRCPVLQYIRGDIINHRFNADWRQDN